MSTTKSNVQKYLEPVIEEFTTGEFYKEVYEAKKEFFEKAGVIYEDDPNYDERMCVFMDWYLFDRELPKFELPPIKLFYKQNRDRLPQEELAIYRDFCSTIHSLFRLKGKPYFKKGLKILDLFSKKNYIIPEEEIDQAFTRGDLFEARLIPFKGHYAFSKGFCFHPIEMESFILKEIKKIRYQEKIRQTKLILQLSAMKLRHLRFQHIDVKHVYSFNSKLTT